MAAGRYITVVTLCIFLTLACQVWSGAAYNNQQSQWSTKHIIPLRGTSRPVEHRADRHLQEATRATTGKYGLRASLVNEDHKLHSRYNLSSMERVKHAAETSRARAWSLESKVRAAAFYKGSGAGRKVLQTAQAPSYDSPVEATPGSYSMALSIGTPPQNFIAIADTGSDLVWIQCAACTECFNQSSPRFDPTTSTTYSPVGCAECSDLGSNELPCTSQCTYQYSYGDQSNTQGDFAQDTVSLGTYNETTSSLIPGFKFGCGLQNNGTFTETDGIVGLARGPISFPSQIAPYLNNATKFSYCLVDKNSDPSITSPIIFGEDAVPTNVTGVLYTPVQTPFDVSMAPYWYVNLEGIAVGGTTLSIPASAFEIDTSTGSGGTIFDSGTTYTVLTDDAYNAVTAEFEAQLTDYTTVDLSQETALELCYDITGLTEVQIPTLVFQFENANFNLPGDNIMVTFGDSQGNRYMCLALMGQSDMNIFGNTQQQNFQVVYEEDALRIGWLPLNCTSL